MEKGRGEGRVYETYWNYTMTRRLNKNKPNLAMNHVCVHGSCFATSNSLRQILVKKNWFLYIIFNVVRKDVFIRDIR